MSDLLHAGAAPASDRPGRTGPGLRSIVFAVCCLVRYRVGGRWYLDDPSARLGMLDRRLSSAEVQQRLTLQTQPSKGRRG